MESPRISGGPGRERARAPRPPRHGAPAAVLVLLLLLATGCSPVYVAKAGIAEARILAGRRPIPDVIRDTATDAATRDKLAYVWEARRFARDSLGLRFDDAYTTFTHLSRDTLALVLSAAPALRLQPRTWWFPIVGRIPYRAYFNYGEAKNTQRKLEEEGYDTYLRPTSAFSTLGWFADPLLSTVTESGTVVVVGTVIHELSHTHLFVPGHVRFNESYATFVGSTGAIAFFCGRQGGGPTSVKCLRARGQWQDRLLFSHFLDGMVAELEADYADSTATRREKLARKAEIFRRARDRYDRRVRPNLREFRFILFGDVPPNNATLLARMRYYHRLYDFQALLDEEGGSVKKAVAKLKAGVGKVEDPFELLPRSDGADSSLGRPTSPR